MLKKGRDVCSAAVRDASRVARVLAQSPNNASIVVLVTDQSGAVVKDAKVSVTNNQTGAVREATSGADGSAIVPGAAADRHLHGRRVEAGLRRRGAQRHHAARGRNGDAEGEAARRIGEDRSHRLRHGRGRARRRADRPSGSTAQTIDETPILGRKVTTLPLFNSAFRQGKGTGDLFVNATYFITGSGSRRTTTFMLDGASNDEGWGRQTMLTTVPVGAVQEVAVLTNAFSAEFGWTAGPAMNIVTKSGTNALHGEGLYLARPGGWQAKTFSTDGFCAPSVPTCTTPTTLHAINPADVPDELNQVSGSIGGPIVKDKTFFFATADYTRAGPHDVPLADAAGVRAAGRRQPDLRRPLPPDALQRPARSQADAVADADGARQLRSLLRHQPERRRRRHERADAWRAATRAARDRSQVNHTTVVSSNLLNEARFALPGRRSGDALGGAEPVDHLHARRVGAVHDRRVARVRHLRPPGAVRRHAVVVARQPQPALRRQRDPPHDRRHGQRARPGDARHVHVPQHDDGAVRSADAGRRAAVLAAGQLRHHQLRAEAVDVGGVRAGPLSACSDQLTLDARAPLRPADADRRDERTSRRASASAGTRAATRAPSIRGGYAMYYTQIRANALASALTGGLDGIVTYTATPGQTGLPDLPDVPCPVQLDPRTLPLSQQPARNITIRAGQRDFYKQQFASYGLNFDLLPNYPDEFVNPRSQVTSIGAEREIMRGLFAGADYVHQHWTDPRSHAST